jgi:hypothetical protein
MRRFEVRMQMKKERVGELRRLWKEAVADNRPGPPPDEVFARLLREYGEIARKAAKQLRD